MRANILALVALLVTSLAQAQEPAAPIRPKAADGRVLNLDFEKGDLSDWTAEGEAFASQPIKGDTVTKRRADMKSEHAGDFWIGGYEKHLDQPRGTLTSVAFKVTQPWGSFLVAGGSADSTRVELVRKDTGKVIFKASGHDTENLERVAVELVPHVGQEIFVRIIDAESGGWGHINFDDFQFHAAKPTLPNRGPARPADLQEFAGLSAEEAAKAMKLPPGFTVKAFAAEPDVTQPIAMTIDERGRVWVAEAHSYPVRVPEEEAKDRILIFEDIDNDGKFDKKTVFAEKLNLVSGLEVGFGGVWVGAAPELLFIPDGDRDDKPDGPATVLLDGWGYQDTHETLNSFIWGPDGWLYGCHGVFTHSKVGKPGTPEDERVKINAGIWRFHPTRHQFEVFAEGTSNPWGVDFNDMGQSFLTCCVIPHLFHVVQGGRFQRQAGQHFNEHTYADIQTIARHRHWVGNQWNEADRAKSDQQGGGHAHAGAMIYLGQRWPKEYYNQLFMNNIHGARLNLDLLTPSGSGYVGDGAPDFCLTNDRWSQILYLRSGPDGNVFLIDWYDANQCHHGNTGGHDRSNGRIFKICYEDPRADPKDWVPNDFDLAKSTDQELIDLQASKNDWWARTARRILQERAAAGTLATADIGKTVDQQLSGKSEQVQLRALWTLHVLGVLDEGRLRQSMEHASEYERAWAIQFACELGSPTDKILEDMAVMARADKSPVVRLYLASALQRLPLEKRWDILVGLLSHAEDASDHNLPLMLWYAAEPLADVDAVRALEIVADGNIEQVLEFMVRRVASKGTPEALAAATQTLSFAREADSARSMLVGLQAGLRGRRQAPMPEGWAETTKKLAGLSQPVLDDLVWQLSVTFGDKAAIDRMRTLLADDKTPLDQRKEYIATLLAAKDAGLLPLLQQFLTKRPLRAEGLRGLAAFEDPETPKRILDLYPQLTAEEKRDALNTLASRPAYALPLMKAVAEKQIAATDITADLARQLRNLKNEEIDTLVTEHWGLLRDSPEEKAKLIAEYKALFEKRPRRQPDPVLGRAVFAKVCAQCHTLFNAGAKVGPELTGSNRKNLEYLLSNVLDPSAVLGKDYRPTIIAAGGRTLTGLIKSRDANSVTLVTANETVVVPQSEIEDERISEKSMMPDDLLKPLKEHEVRSLVAYLSGDTQQPLFANPENAVSFFNGKDLAGWEGDPQLWKVENGEIVGTSPGLKRNEFLRGPLVAGDFTLSLQVKLTPNAGNSGIQFRSEPLPGGEMKGYQADVGVGWWGKLYEEHGRALLWDKSGEAHVKPDDWNDYVIIAKGSKIQTKINGHLCVDLDDPEGSKSGLIGLQLHSGGAFEVRYRNIKLEVGGENTAEPATEKRVGNGQ